MYGRGRDCGECGRVRSHGGWRTRRSVHFLRPLELERGGGGGRGRELEEIWGVGELGKEAGEETGCVREREEGEGEQQRRWRRREKEKGDRG